MGLLSSAKKKAKKFLKSDLGKIAAAYATYKLAPYAWGSQAGGSGGWGAGWKKFGVPFMSGLKQKGIPMAGEEGVTGIPGALYRAGSFIGKHPYITAGGITAGLGYALEDEDDLPEELKLVRSYLKAWNVSI